MKSYLRKFTLLAGAILIIGLVPDSLPVRIPRGTLLPVTGSDSTSIQAPSASDSDPQTSHTTVKETIPPTPPSAPAHETDLEPQRRELNSNIWLKYAPESDGEAQLRDRLENPSRTGVRSSESVDLFLHLPPDPAMQEPLRVLIVLHGMGQRGDVFAQNLIVDADRNHWLLVAPTLPYRDVMDPVKLSEDDLRFAWVLRDMLDNLPKKLGLKLQRQAMVFGYSRGAQLAHRFALFYPERVDTVASISAGSYTLPTEKRTNEKGTQILPLPYGVGDLEQHLGRALDGEQLKSVSFWLAVGSNDNRVDDVPRAFDQYVGKTRLDRARAFQNALLTLGVKVRLIVFPNTGHEITSSMWGSALEFMRDDELSRHRALHIMRDDELSRHSND